MMGTLPLGGVRPEDAAHVVVAFTERLSRLHDGVVPRRFPWTAAVHALGRDAFAPHIHLGVIDEDIDEQAGGAHTGPRAIGLSELGTTELLRQAWADSLNDVFAGTGDLVSAKSWKRLAAAAAAAGDKELAAYYAGCDAIKALHIGPAIAAAVRDGRPIFSERFRASAERYRQSYTQRQTATAGGPLVLRPADSPFGAKASSRPTRTLLEQSARAGQSAADQQAALDLEGLPLWQPRPASDGGLERAPGALPVEATEKPAIDDASVKRKLEALADDALESLRLAQHRERLRQVSR